MPEPKNLQALARDFRQYAGETNMPVYARMMLQAADDLEALAVDEDAQSPSETGRRSA